MTRLGKPFNQMWRSLWIGASCFAFIIIGICVLKFYEDEMRMRERGQLVSSIVDQQFHDLTVPTSAAASLLVPAGAPGRWADDSVELKRWLIQESMASVIGPVGVLRHLETLRRTHRYSRLMDVSLDRWEGDLRRWSDEMRSRRLTSSDDLFREGRANYFEASGYSKIGRRYDATVLQLWSISLLTRYISNNPFDSNVPEALFMLGVEYLGLEPALPARMRGDRILNLCSELYPDSFWANRSNGVWREAVSHET